MSTLEEVRREIGLTRERVRQIQVEALRRLRETMEQRGLSVEAIFSWPGRHPIRLIRVHV